MKDDLRFVRELGDFRIEQGWSNELATKLVEASREPAIQERTPKDAKERFRDVEAAWRWHDEPEIGPIVYPLWDNVEQKLGGVAWFSYKSHEELGPEHQATFAIRLYESARGKKLSYPFASSVHEDFTSLPIAKHTSGTWLETDTDNAPALTTYKKLGYETLKIVGDRELMVRPLGVAPATSELDR